MHGSRLRVAAASAVVVALLLCPSAVWACAVCASNGDGEASVQAFRFSTLIMSLFPLALIGGTAYWVRRRFRAHEQAADEFAQQHEARAVAELHSGAIGD
jgi:hypothetical protein